MFGSVWAITRLQSVDVSWSVSSGTQHGAEQARLPHKEPFNNLITQSHVSNVHDQVYKHQDFMLHAKVNEVI